MFYFASIKVYGSKLGSKFLRYYFYKDFQWFTCVYMKLLISLNFANHYIKWNMQK